MPALLINDEIYGDTPTKDASALKFDDTTAQLGADDVQGAIENVKSILDNAFTRKKATVNSTYGSGDVYEVSIGKLAVVTGTVTFSVEKPSGSSNVIASGLSGAISGTAFVSSNIQDAYPVYITGVGNLVSNAAIPSGTILRFTVAYVIK